MEQHASARKIAPRILDSALDILKPVQAKLSVTIVEGSPEQCIVDVAENSDIDMIVMGARGIMDMPQTFAPTIIERLIRIEEDIRKTRLIESGRILDDAREQLKKSFGNIDVITAEGDSTRESLKTAEALKANLIAVGCRGLRGLKGIMGSVSRNILSHSECSVLIGKMCKD